MSAQREIRRAAKRALRERLPSTLQQAWDLEREQMVQAIGALMRKRRWRYKHLADDLGTEFARIREGAAE